MLTLKPLSKDAVPAAKAELLRPPGNDDSLLRWNTCVRVLRINPHLGSSQEREQVVQSE
jgi:hypothetical protein